MAARAVIVFAFLCVLIQSEGHNIPSFFRRRNPDGTYNTERPPKREFIRKLNAAASITVTPTGPISGDIVLATVTWSGIDKPTTEDWIGFYCPGNSDDHDYLDYAWNSNKAASGSIQFNVTNMRDNYQFRYIANNTAYIVVAVSNIVSWVAHQPLQANVALTGNKGEMRVHWNSDYNTDAPTVQYGLQSGSYTSNKTGTSSTYSASDMCNDPANTTSAIYYRNPGYFHDVLLTGLSISTRYYYRYGQGNVWSAEASFVTAPAVGADQNVKFIMYADQGAVGCFRDYEGCDNAPTVIQRVYEEVQKNAINLVLHIGDIAYAVSYGYLWEMYGTEIEPLSKNVAYMVANGNHEYDHTGTTGKDPSGASGNGFHPPWGNYGDDSGGECSVPFYHRYHMPDNGNALFWYSFDYGPVHFTTFSSEHDFTVGSTQYNWFESDLAKVDRSVTPWLIVNAHRPMYSSENYASDWKVAENMQAQLEPLLLKYQVDLMLAGHYHAYERTCPVYNQTCCPSTQSCTTHVVAGMAGIDLDGAGWFKSTWSVYHDESHFGYIRLTTNSSPKQTLLLEYVNDDDGKTLDSVTLTK